MTVFPVTGAQLAQNGSHKVAMANLPRSVATRSWLPFNVLDPQYGAVGNGVTDDTVAVAAAVSAASTQYVATGAPGYVVFPAGYNFLLSRVLLTSGVRFWAYGASITPNLSGIPNSGGMFMIAGNQQLSDLGILGGTWLGTGLETNEQQIFYSGSNVSVTDSYFRDMICKNWAVNCLYVRNPTRCVIQACHMFACGQSSTGNVIDIVYDGTQAAAGEVVITDNIVEAAGSASIAIVSTAGGSPGLVKGLIRGNIVSGMSSGSPNTLNTGAISFEVDVGASNAAAVTISDNIVYGYGTNGAILCEGTQTKTLTKVMGNLVVNPNGPGIGINGTNSEVEAINNRIFAASAFGGGVAPTLQTGNKFSAGAAQGRAILSGGTVTVSTAEIIAADNVLLSRVVTGGTVGELTLGTIVPGTSFVINSSSGTDTSTIYWRIDH